MAGHSKWKQIKHKKAVTDKKRSEAFGKILGAISAEARGNNDPATNPRLRSLIEKAKQQNIPKDRIRNALEKREKSGGLKKVIIEAYGPGGTAIIIKANTDNSNRTISELKHILNKRGASVGEPGSVKWIFENSSSSQKPKFAQSLNNDDSKRLQGLIEELEQYPDVEQIVTNKE